MLRPITTRLGGPERAIRHRRLVLLRPHATRLLLLTPTEKSLDTFVVLRLGLLVDRVIFVHLPRGPIPTKTRMRRVRRTAKITRHLALSPQLDGLDRLLPAQQHHRWFAARWLAWLAPAALPHLVHLDVCPVWGSRATAVSRALARSKISAG